MTDRELLELAAKSAGLSVKYEEAHSCYWIELGQGIPIDVWNPLDHDGDALRLAAVLRLIVSTQESEAWAQFLGIEGEFITIKEPIENDLCAALRRAIVRAAAAIAVALAAKEGAQHG